ncbi:hypothetical protein [Nostoc sp.]|uniref:hypothetical protein n=1 Tax=Nostoc sp. TaxID=1180 RepID=UPI002FF56EA8
MPQSKSHVVMRVGSRPHNSTQLLETLCAFVTKRNYELRITNYELRITNYELRITNYLISPGSRKG